MKTILCISLVLLSSLFQSSYGYSCYSIMTRGSISRLPKFYYDAYINSLENSLLTMPAVGTVLGNLSLTLKNTRNTPVYTPTYTLSGPAQIAINSSTGVLTLISSINYDTIPSVSLSVNISLNNIPFQNCQLKLKIWPRNYYLLFIGDSDRADIIDITPVGTVIANRLYVLDNVRNLGSTINVVCNATRTPDCQYVAISVQRISPNMSQVAIKTAQSSIIPGKSCLNLYLVATDSGVNTQADKAKFTVQIINSTKLMPRFGRSMVYSIITVNTTYPAVNNLTKVYASLANPYDELIFTKKNDINNWFDMSVINSTKDKSSGWVYVLAFTVNQPILLPANRTSLMYYFEVVAQKKSDLAILRNRTVSCSVWVNIVSRNLMPPTFNQPIYSATVVQGTTSINVPSIVITDVNLNGAYIISVSQVPYQYKNIFGITTTRGSGKTTVQLKVLQPKYLVYGDVLKGSYNVTIIATDISTRARLSSSSVVNVVVLA